MLRHLGESHKLTKEQNTFMHSRTPVAIGEHVDNAERHAADQDKIAEVEKNMASVLAETQAYRRRAAFAEEDLDFFETRAARKAQQAQETDNFVEVSRLGLSRGRTLLLSQTKSISQPSKG
jgi:regulator of protease activity HflC (stomatin/prohibitin superfamily)